MLTLCLISDEVVNLESEVVGIGPFSFLWLYKNQRDIFQKYMLAEGGTGRQEMKAAFLLAALTQLPVSFFSNNAPLQDDCMTGTNNLYMHRNS